MFGLFMKFLEYVWGVLEDENGDVFKMGVWNKIVDYDGKFKIIEL